MAAVKSAVAFWKRNAQLQVKKLEYKNVSANFQFTLKGNQFLKRAFIFNNGPSVTQAAITIGTAAAGTQFDAGATVAALNTGVRVLTTVQPLRTDRTVYVESAAWQTKVHVVFEIEEFPPVDDPS